MHIPGIYQKCPTGLKLAIQVNYGIPILFLLLIYIRDKFRQTAQQILHVAKLKKRYCVLLIISPLTMSFIVCWFYRIRLSYKKTQKRSNWVTDTPSLEITTKREVEGSTPKINDETNFNKLDKKVAISIKKADQFNQVTQPNTNQDRTSTTVKERAIQTFNPFFNGGSKNPNQNSMGKKSDTIEANLSGNKKLRDLNSTQNTIVKINRGKDNDLKDSNYTIKLSHHRLKDQVQEADQGTKGISDDSVPTISLSLDNDKKHKDDDNKQSFEDQRSENTQCDNGNIDSGETAENQFESEGHVDLRLSGPISLQKKHNNKTKNINKSTNFRTSNIRTKFQSNLKQDLQTIRESDELNHENSFYSDKPNCHGNLSLDSNTSQDNTDFSEDTGSSPTIPLKNRSIPSKNIFDLFEL